MAGMVSERRTETQRERKRNARSVFCRQPAVAGLRMWHLGADPAGMKEPVFLWEAALFEEGLKGEEKGDGRWNITAQLH